MATFYEIYQNYLQNPYGGVNALPGVNAISGTMGATPISSMSGGDGIGEVSSVSPVGSVSNVSNVGGFGNVDTSPKGIAGLVASAVLGGPAGLALNIGTQLADLPSVSQMVRNAIAGLGFGGDSTSTGTANATDTGDMGSEAANNAATDAANASAGVGDGGGPGGGDSGDTGGPFRDGGRVGLYDGGSTFDNYRALNLGGRVGMAGGGVSQGLDYLMGIERRGYAEGGTGPRMIDGVSQEGILPGFIKRRSEFYNADGTINQEKIKAANFFYNADGTVNQVIPPTEFYYERIGKGGIGEGGGYDPKTYERIVAEGSNLYGGYSGNKISQVEDPLGLIQRLNKAGGNRTPFDNISYLPSEGGYVQWDGTSWTVTSPEMIEQRIKDWESVNYSPIQPPNTLNAQTTPTEDFSDYVTKTTPTVAEQIISTNNSSPALTSVAETLFPQGDFLNIKETAASPTEYNIEATKDLVENLPGGIVKDIVAPTAAFALSLPYDAIQAYQRMEPGSGIQGFGKAFQAERPLESAFERFTGAAGPLAENINTAISSFNPFQKQQYMNYAVQNPDQAIAAAQRNKDFLAATQKNTNPATPAPASMADGGRVFYLQGGLASLLG
jgi:hypothetical protein